MPTAMTHAMSACAIGVLFPRGQASARTLIIGALCAVLPDVDVIGFRFGVQYGDVLGHRGLTHSVAFAAVVATLACLVARSTLWLYFFLAAVSHGVLDAFTDGGLGVALLSPFTNARYFAPWRPIHVSPIGLRHFFEAGGASALLSELIWVWLPCGLLVASVHAWRRTRKGEMEC